MAFRMGFVFVAAGCAQLIYVELATLETLIWWQVGGVTLFAILAIGVILAISGNWMLAELQDLMLRGLDSIPALLAG